MAHQVKDRKEAGRLSLKRSVLIWVGAGLLGWMIVFVGIYSFFRFTRTPGDEIGAPMIASDYDGRTLSEIAPSAGSPSNDASAMQEQLQQQWGVAPEN